MRVSTSLETRVSTIFIAVSLITSASLPGAIDLPTKTSSLFSGSGNCAMCHSGVGGAFLTEAGADISPVTLWGSTMMANAARDPFWQAKVTAEVAEHPALKTVIETKCATCHMPMGKTEAFHQGASQFSIEEGLGDPLSMDGVSCTLCHQIRKDNLDEKYSFSGEYAITDSRMIFGPYPSPLEMPMLHHVEYRPVFSEHVQRSELCGTCHTLFTPFIDNRGQIGGNFPEQTTYLEWTNSIYPSESVECQTCHMPATDEAIKISSLPPWLTTLRRPIYRHDLVGANIFMNRLLKQQDLKTGSISSKSQYDETLSKTLKMLQKGTIDLSLKGNVNVDEDSLDLTVSLTNRSGHKFPTGYPSRRAWLHVLVKDQNEEVVFESGKWGKKGEIVGLSAGYEPHHRTITSPSQTQVYQTVMGDVDNRVTYTLLRGAQHLKDNRLPPKGFSTSSNEYAHMAIAGNAVDDPDFNRGKDGVEGSGSDEVHYHIPVSDKDTEFEVIVEMRYQTLSPRFARDLLAHESARISKFNDSLESADQTPVLVDSVSATFTKPTAEGSLTDLTPALVLRESDRVKSGGDKRNPLEMTWTRMNASRKGSCNDEQP